MRRFSTALGSALLVLSIAFMGAAAQADDPYSAPGGYVTIGGLTGFQNFSRVEGADVDNSLGFQIRVGARLLEFLALEIEGDFFSGFDVDVDPPDDAEPPADIGRFVLEGGNITANIKGYIPLGRIQPYGLFGIGGMWANVRTRDATGSICRPGYWGWWCSPTYTRLIDGGGFVMKLGGGADVWITEDWALTMDATYVLPTGDLSDLKYVNLGWGAKFKF